MGKRKFRNDRESNEASHKTDRKSKKKGKDNESGGFNGTSQPLPAVEHETTVVETLQEWTQVEVMHFDVDGARVRFANDQDFEESLG